MAGSLSLTVGPITATKSLTASNADIEAAVRRAAKELGYPGDADSDAAQTVANWFVAALVRFARDASRGNRVNAALGTTLSTQNAIADPFDE